MDKVEDFFEEVRKAIVAIPKKPNFIMKEATVVGIKLNSDMLDKLTKASYLTNEKDYKLTGVKVYLDETANRPKYIVEGEIMASFHPEVLKGDSAIGEAVNEQKEVLRIIFEKKVNIGHFYFVVFVLKKDYESCKLNNNNVVFNICDTEKGFLTEEEFDLLKRWSEK